MGDAQAARRWIVDTEVATMTGLPVSTIRSWRHRRKGPPFYKLQGCVRYDRDEIEDWITASRELAS
jgi:predicted DNA-binding transcriptional regulator AlpA